MPSATLQLELRGHSNTARWGLEERGPADGLRTPAPSASAGRREVRQEASGDPWSVPPNPHPPHC